VSVYSGLKFQDHCQVHFSDNATRTISRQRRNDSKMDDQMQEFLKGTPQVGRGRGAKLSTVWADFELN